MNIRLDDRSPNAPGIDQASTDDPSWESDSGAPGYHEPTSIAPQELLATLDAEIAGRAHARFLATLTALTAGGLKPYFAERGFILLHGDCLDLLPRLRASTISADLIVTSPPYNIGKVYESIADVADYVQWSIRWISEAHKATKAHGSFWLNLGYLEVPQRGKCVPLPYLLWDKTPFYMQQEIVWHYGAGVASKHRFSPRNEKWLFFTASDEEYTFNLDDVRDPNVKYPNQKKNGKLKCNPLGKNPTDVWEFAKVTSGANRSSKERTSHPAQFPLGIVSRIVKVSSNVGDVVMDPFSGSASSGVASVGTGRVYIGIEKRKDYCDLSVDRIRQFWDEQDASTRQRALFT